MSIVANMKTSPRLNYSYTPSRPSRMRNGLDPKNGAPPETNVVGVQIADAKDNMKLFRPGKYPVVRGSPIDAGRQTSVPVDGGLRAEA